jgi:lipoprotein-releasing system permease protein
MPFRFKIAARYLLSNRFQTVLLLTGVAIGVLVFCFMSALINGLAQYQIDQTVGAIPHLTFEPRDREPKVLPAADRAAVLPAVLNGNLQRTQIRDWQALLETLAADPMVKVAVPVVSGNALLTRGQAVGSVAITGVKPEQLSDIADIAPSIVAGAPELDLDGILIGARLAKNLSVSVGQPIVLRSDRGRERTVKVRGIFRLGIESLDERVAYMNFKAARALLDLDNGVSRVEVKLFDLNAAPALAATYGEATGLKVTSWVEKNRRLFDAIQGQGSTGSLIKLFSIITIVIGVASALLLTSMRRRAEIGIMRSMGVSKEFVTTVFVFQGVLVGFVGAILGASLGYGFCWLLAEFAKRPDGRAFFTIDVAQGNYLAGIALATVASALASILPARAASRIDPLEAISQ